MNKSNREQNKKEYTIQEKIDYYEKQIKRMHSDLAFAHERLADLYTKLWNKDIKAVAEEKRVEDIVELAKQVKQD